MRRAQPRIDSDRDLKTFFLIIFNFSDMRNLIFMMQALRKRISRSSYEDIRFAVPLKVVDNNRLYLAMQCEMKSLRIGVSLGTSLR
jgi:hypothetical protein